MDNTGGGTALDTDFTLTATGDASTGPTVITGTTPVTAVNAPVGVYALTETGPDGYTSTGFSCTGGGTLVGNKLTITQADAGNTITCTIANTYTPGAVAPKLGLVKTVDNAGGGGALITDFTLTATGPMIVTGTTPVGPVNVPVGVYTLTETGPVDYTAGFSCTGGGTLVGNKLTITQADADNTITCTIANTYNQVGPVAAQLGLQKTVNNTGGGTASDTDFTLTATGPTVITGTTPVPPVNAPVGVYTLTETGPDGYTSTGFSCTGGGTLVGNKLTITQADAGKTITCTIANKFTPLIAAKLGLQKTVDNAGGGGALITDFTLTATGPTVVTGTTPVLPVNVPVGVYTLTETGPVDYTAGFNCTGGGRLVGNQLTIGLSDAGKTITCTIANKYNQVGPVAAQLGLLKTVSGGTAAAVDFTLTATGDASTGPTVITGTTPVTPVNVPVGVYTLTETGPDGYTAGFSCDGGTLDGNQLTITQADAGKTITCTIANTFTGLVPPGPGERTDIPTLSEWGMLVFTLVLGCTAVLFMRKKRKS